MSQTFAQLINGKSATVEFSAGSASTPAVSFSGDTNTGIYSPGADQVAISTNGTGRLFVNSSGQIGLSIASPSAALDIASGNRDSGGLGGALTVGADDSATSRTNNTRKLGLINTPHYANATGKLFLIAGDSGSSSNDIYIGGGYTGYTCAQTIRFHVQSSNTTTGPNEVARIDSSGRLGLGTSTVGSLLHLSQSGGNAKIFIQRSDSANNSDDYGSIVWRSSGNYNNGGIGVARQSGEDNGYMYFSTGSGGTLSERVRITSGGLVGIGTTSPSYSLDVNGVIQARSGASLILQNDTGNDNASMRCAGSAVGAASLLFNTAGSERARIDSSGRLLVGTTTATGNSVVQILKNGGDGFLVRNADTNYEALTIQANTGSVDLVATSGGSVGRPPMRFITNDAERMRISTTGAVYFKKTTNDYTTEGAIINQGAGAGSDTSFVTVGGTAATFARSTTDGTVISLRREGTQVGTISVSTTATAYNTSSDYRLKENVVPLTGAADRINQLQVHRFNFIGNPDTTVDGFIAHEAQEVVPECATGTKDEVDVDGNPVYQGIDQSKLVPLLTAALQEALAEIKSLKARVTALEP